NLDRLASEGIRFTDAHSPSSVCTPTRYGLLTGRYCWRSRLKAQVLGPWGATLIEDGRLTAPALLRQHGYSTACVGKWHLGWNWVNILPDCAARAIRTIEEAAKRQPQKPFFLYFPLTAPHYPVVPDAEFRGKSGAGDFGDFVIQSDAVVGQVLDALKRTGVAD